MFLVFMSSQLLLAVVLTVQEELAKNFEKSSEDGRKAPHVHQVILKSLKQNLDMWDSWFHGDEEFSDSSDCHSLKIFKPDVKTSILSNKAVKHSTNALRLYVTVSAKTGHVRTW